MKPSLKYHTLCVSLFTACNAFGALIWLASPYFTGQKEPWDSPTLYYTGCLVLGGTAAGCLLPKRFLLWPVGIWVGQAVGFLWCMHLNQRIAPLAPLGFIFFLPIYSLWSLLGSYLGAQAAGFLRLLLHKGVTH